MKIIGTTGDYREQYICTVSKGEIEKYLGLYYNNMPVPKIGDEIDLGRGYDYASKIEQAMASTRALVKDNQAVITAIMQGMSIEALVAAAQRSGVETTETPHA